MTQRSLLGASQRSLVPGAPHASNFSGIVDGRSTNPNHQVQPLQAASMYKILFLLFREIDACHTLAYVEISFLQGRLPIIPQQKFPFACQTTSGSYHNSLMTGLCILAGCLPSHKLSCNSSKHGSSCAQAECICITKAGQPLRHAFSQVWQLNLSLFHYHILHLIKVNSS